MSVKFWNAMKEAWKAGRKAFYDNLDTPKVAAVPEMPFRSDLERKAAIHEVGHALVAWIGHPYVTELTEISFTSQGAGKVLYNYNRGFRPRPSLDHLWCECLVSLGGIAGEMVHFKKTRSLPAAKDLERARDAAKEIVRRGGSHKAPWNTAEVDRVAGSPFDVSKMLRSIKEGTPEALVMNQAYDRAKFLIMTNEDLQAKILDALLRHGTMGPREIRQVFGHRTFHLRAVE